MVNKKVLLISFYNNKAMEVRCLEKALETAGYDVYVTFFKNYNSVKPEICTEKEISLLIDLIGAFNPAVVGLSIMSTCYLDAVLKVNNAIKENFDIPVVWSGVYPTLFPADCMKYTDYVVRGEGGHAIIELAKTIRDKKKLMAVQNLGHHTQDGVKVNDIRALSEDPDEIGIPVIGGDNKFSIDHDKISYGDPQLNSVSYELSITKSCPFVCSYCSSINLRRLYKGKEKHIRYRSVTAVINELVEAKRKIKNLRYIRFWDEIFSDDKDWINEFCDSYVKNINLPFEIWCHPLKVRESIIRRLTGVGLYKVVMGIQSGSERILNNIFHRYEHTQEIFKACNILNECKVPEVVYDFMFLHPFETEEDLIVTYELCRKLPRPFELQIHGLNFLPGTDIVKIALERNIIDYDKLNKIAYGTMEEQYSSYWGVHNKHLKLNFWYSLIYLSQFTGLSTVADYLALHSQRTFALKTAQLLCKISKKLAKIRYIYKKTGMIAASTIQQTVFRRKEKIKLKKAFTNYMQ